MSKKQKVTVVSVFVAILIVIGAAAALLNHQKTQEGVKHFQIEVISERDNYANVTECESAEEFLGMFMRSFEGCEWEDSTYGTYITGFNGMQQDLDNQYWWCITVNDQENNLGADELPLTEGSKYTFSLKKGW